MTIACPASHTELARASAGKEDGHVPGHQYRDIHCLISRRGDRFRAAIVHVWGSCQGYNEEHGRRAVIGRGDTIAEAAGAAKQLAAEADMPADYLAEAVSLAVDRAEEAAD